MNDKTRALLTSYLRVLFGCLTTAYLAVAGSAAPWALSVDDWQKISNGVWGALLVTAVNYFRTGETRFGRHAQDMGMGGEDTLTPPDGQVQTKEGEVPAVIPVLADPPEDAAPTQTDNRPKDGDPDVTLPQNAEFSGEMR